MRAKLLIAISVLALSASVSTYAQSFTTDVPFQFTAGEKALPAGSYTFSKTTDNRLLIRNAQGGQVIMQVLSRVSSPAPLFDCGLVFDVSGNARTVSEVWIPGEAGLLVHNVPPGHTSQRLIGIRTGSAKLDGKTAFAQSCAVCHGSQGNGNPDADKFFKITIPRLNSEYVQAKSDQEIREIIVGGRRKMEPARIEEQGMRHLLPTQSVDEIIAYLRTLKK
jgi:mono/diheme cytochrome c family protein